MLAVLLAAPFLAQADATIANVATPSIRSGLGASGAALELVIGGYLVAFAVLLITGARLGQTHGYRRVFLCGVGAFTAASLACGLSPNPTVLIIARVVQGAAAAMMFPQALTGIQLHFTGRERVRAIGLYAMALSAGAVTGQILGGVLISADLLGTGWRAIFLVNVPIGVLVLAAARWLPADGRRTTRRVDALGVATLSVAVLLLVLPLTLGHATGWPLWAWLCLAASLPAGAAFVVSQRRVGAPGRSPLVNLAVLARPAVSWALLTLLIATGSYLALLFTLAQYLQSGLGSDPLVSGFAMVPWVAAFGLAGQVVRRLPVRLIAVIPTLGCLLLAAAYLVISVTLFTDGYAQGLLIVLLGFGGFGLGLQFSALIGHLTTTVPTDYAPDISGVASTTAQIGGALGVAALGSLYLSLATSPGPAYATHAFAITTAVLGALALIASLSARRATRRERPR